MIKKLILGVLFISALNAKDTIYQLPDESQLQSIIRTAEVQSGAMARVAENGKLAKRLAGKALILHQQIEQERQNNKLLFTSFSLERRVNFAVHSAYKGEDRECRHKVAASITKGILATLPSLYSEYIFLKEKQIDETAYQKNPNVYKLAYDAWFHSQCTSSSVKN